MKIHNVMVIVRVSFGTYFCCPNISNVSREGVAVKTRSLSSITKKVFIFHTRLHLQGNGGPPGLIVQINYV